MKRRHLFPALLGASAAAAALPASAKTAPAAKASKSMAVEAVQLPAWAERDGKRLPLAPGATVTQADEVQTGAGAALVLKLPEGSLVRLGEKTRLSVQRMEVNSETGRTAVNADLKVIDGFFRFTTSAVAKVFGERKVNVSLRTATVGVRGTDFWSMTDAAHDATCLFEGQVALQTRDQGDLSLDAPTAFWARFFDKPVQPVGQATPAELKKFIGTTELQPGKGVAVAGGRWRVVAAAPESVAAAGALASRLRQEGYPIEVLAKTVDSRKVHEVRINQLASKEDAASVLQKIAGVEGVQGRVALSA